MRCVTVGLIDTAVAVAGIAAGADTPPVAIAIPLAVLGAGTVAAVAYGWTGDRPGIAVVAVARTLSAFLAMPGFVAGGPALAAAVVLVTAGAIALVLLVTAWPSISAARHRAT